MRKINYLVSLLVYFFIISCQPTEEIITEKNYKASLKIQTIQFSELKILNRKAYESLKNYDAKIQSQTQRGLNENNTYQIDQTAVRVISNQNGYISYTIPVVQPDRKLIQNLVFSQYKNNTSRITLNEYVLRNDFYTIPSNLTQIYITETKVYEVNNPNLLASRGGVLDSWCVEIGYYETVDKCEGEVVTPGERPDCFNSDGTRATKEVFIAVASDCSSSGGGSSSSGSGNWTPPPSGGNTGGTYDNTGGGGGFGNNYGLSGDNFGGVISSPSEPTLGLTPYEMSSITLNRYLTNLTVYNNLVATDTIYNPGMNTAIFYTIANYVFENGGLNDVMKLDIENVLTQFTAINALYGPNKTYDEIIAYKIQALNYFLKNPNTTFEQYTNWYPFQIEGVDYYYDENYWNNPNLTFTQQQLPSRNAYIDAIPKFPNGQTMTGADNLYNLVGGDVKTVRTQDPENTGNTCALKVSICLNRCGITIPNIPGQTIKGGGTEFSDKYFFLNSKALNSWMRETFGTNPATNTTPFNANHVSVTGEQGGTNGENFKTLLNGVIGIYSMIVKEDKVTEFGATGHADFILTTSAGAVKCVNGCFFNAPVERIDVWKLN